MSIINEQYWPCRVCGYDRDFDAWGGDENESFTYDICDCCGAEAGTDDFNIEVVRRYRKEWSENDCKWFLTNLKPDSWNLEEQIAKVLAKWQ